MTFECFMLSKDEERLMWCITVYIVTHSAAETIADHIHINVIEMCSH